MPPGQCVESKKFLKEVDFFGRYYNGRYAMQKKKKKKKMKKIKKKKARQT